MANRSSAQVYNTLKATDLLQINRDNMLFANDQNFQTALTMPMVLQDQLLAVSKHCI